MSGGEDPRIDSLEHRRRVQLGYDTIADEYAADRRDAEWEGERALLEAFSDRLEPGERVLDAGCGDGHPIASRLAANDTLDVVGLDISSEQLRRARETVPKVGITQGDLTSLPVRDRAFDAVCSFHAVIHVPRDEHLETFREFARVLRPGGHLLVSLGDGAWEGTNDDWLETGTEMRWSFYGIERNRELLEQAGFTVKDERLIEDELGDGGGAFRYVIGRLTE